MSTTARSETRLLVNGSTISFPGIGWAEVFGEKSHERAARIVACVNGCAGVAEPQAVADVLVIVANVVKSTECTCVVARCLGDSPTMPDCTHCVLKRALAHARGVAPGGEGGGNG